jgi:hypothetical protein
VARVSRLAARDVNPLQGMSHLSPRPTVHAGRSQRSGAESKRQACRIRSKSRAFVRLWRPSYFLFAWPRARRMRARTAKLARRAKGRMPGVKRNITKEKGHPAWRLPPIHGRQVREPGPGFSNGHPARAKRSRHPCRLPLRGLSTPTHRRTGAPVEQRAVQARTFQKSGAEPKPLRAASRAASSWSHLVQCRD